MTNTKIWSIEEIKELLENNDTMVLRSVIKLWELQTQEEKEECKTLTHNGVGFSGFDAELLSSFAQQAIWKGYLSRKQTFIARKRLYKYCGQLVKIANKVI